MQQQQQHHHRSMTPSASSRAATATDAVGQAPPADAGAHSGTSSSAISTDMGLVRSTTPPPPPYPPSPTAAAAEAEGPGNVGATPTTGADEKNVGEINDIDYPRLVPYGPAPAAPAPARSSSRAPARAPARQPKIRDRKARLCKNWMQNEECPEGDKCYYAHGLEDQLRVPMTRLTDRKDRCQNYLKGKCRNGVNCRRPHVVGP